MLALGSTFLSSLLFWTFWTSHLLAVHASSSIWNIDIWTGPAPSPEEGPPLSATATRDPSLLWREVVSIVGAYVATVSLLLGCLLTTGKRLRRSAQESNHTLEVEMIKPTLRSPDVSAQSPEWSNVQWPSPLSTTTDGALWSSPQRKTRSYSLPFSGGPKGRASVTSRTESMSTVDENVVRADKVRAQEEMERLYAAVMDHDEKQASMSPELNGVGRQSPQKRKPQRLTPVEGPPEFRHLKHGPASPPLSPLSPLSPRHIPSAYARSQLHSVTTQQDGPASPRETPISPRSERFSRLSSLSFLSSRSRNSSHTPDRLSRTSARNLTISSPIPSPQLTARDYPDDAPLSPRRYTPGPPPLNPAQQAKAARLNEQNRANSTDTIKPRPTPPALNIRTGSSATTLPFRAYETPSSAPSTKTTIIERRQSLLGPQGPRTGVPRTPYSPYMPFTPITPLTPSRVVGRQERKQREKEAGMRVLMEDDLVQNDEDMW